MKVVAQVGSTFLVATGGTGSNASGRMVDLASGKVYGEVALASLALKGAWEEVTDHEGADAALALARKASTR